MNSDMVKPEKFGHLHLVYHLTVSSMCYYHRVVMPPTNSYILKNLLQTPTMSCKNLIFRLNLLFSFTFFHMHQAVL